MRAPAEELSPLSYGPLHVDLLAKRAMVCSEELELTRREYDLLVHLMRHPGKVLSREHILEDVWGLKYLGASRTIDAHIRRLRAKMGSHASLIQTLVGVGYRLGEQE